MSSVHDQLGRVRRPRSSPQMHYGLKTPGGTPPDDRHHLPFVLGVLGDYSGNAPSRPPGPLADRKFVNIDRDNFDQVVEYFAPGLSVVVENTLKGDGSELPVRLSFKSMADFESGRIVRQLPALSEMLGTRDALRDLLVRLDASERLEERLGLLLRDPREMERLKDELHGPAGEPRHGGVIEDLAGVFPPGVGLPRARAMLAALIQAAAGHRETVPYVDRTIRAHIGAIDAAMSRQLAVVMRHPDFQRLEGGWRGLHYLVFNAETCTSLKIRVLNVSKEELVRDLRAAGPYRPHVVRVVQAELDTPGGEPFGVMIGDFEWSNGFDDVATLGRVAHCAAAAFCPFISAVSCRFFGLDSWEGLAEAGDLGRIIASDEYAGWRQFRGSEDSRFVVLTLPRALARLPYGPDTRPVEDFCYEELGPAGPVPANHYTWMSTAYVLGTVLAASFARHGHCMAVCGREGGEVTGLPYRAFPTDDSSFDHACPTEVGVNRREGELSGLGFLPLCHHKNTDYAVFFGGQTCHEPKAHAGPQGRLAAEDAVVSARLPCVMLTSQFMHHVRVIAREKAGDFRGPGECEAWLNEWINHYVDAAPDAGPEMRTRYPLRDAGVRVTEVPGEPNAWLAEVRLWPWLPHEGLHGPLTLAVRLPAGAARRRT